MLFALGAVSTALDALQTLASSKSSSTQQTGFKQGANNPFSIDGATSSSATTTSSTSSGNCAPISPETMSALIAAQGQSSTSTTSVSTSDSTSSTPTTREAALKDLFSQIDANGDGKIDKTEFEDALGAGGTNLANADKVFDKLDTDGDGTVSLDEMDKALKNGHGHHHAQGAGGSGDGSDSSDSSKSGGGSTRTTVVNSDGSTTTTVKYADGFKVTSTVPGAPSASGAGNSPYNWFAQLMQQGQTGSGSTSAASSLSMSV